MTITEVMNTSGRFNCVRRRLLRLFSVISLVICLTTAVMWVRSYFRADYLTRKDYKESPTAAIQRVQALVFYQGSVSYYSYLVDDRSPLSESYNYWDFDDTENGWDPWSISSTSFARRLGFGYEYSTQPAASNSGLITPMVFRIRVPYWIIFVLTAIKPWRSIARFMRHVRRLRTGCCLFCGYDLRASPDRCPECGAASDPSPSGRG